MSTKEKQEKLIQNMRKWQKVETQTIKQAAEIMEKTDNPLVLLVMEIIQRDSAIHHRVQKLIADSLEEKTIPVTFEDLGNIWELIEQHTEIEKGIESLAKESLEAIKGSRNVIQEYLLTYLMEDEKKHDNLLTNLGLIKKGMYGSG